MTIEYDFSDIFDAVDYMFNIADDGNYPINMETACDKLRIALNKFFTKDFECNRVTYTINTDKQFFGVYIHPSVESNRAFARNMIAGYGMCTNEFEPFKFNKYTLEIDGKLIRTFDLNSTELATIIIAEIAALNGPQASEQLRNVMDAYIAQTGITINTKVIMDYLSVFELVSIITIHNLFSVFEKPAIDSISVPDIIQGYDLGLYYSGGIRKLLDSGAKSPEIDLSTVMISWYFNNYTNLLNNRNVEYMLRNSISTEGSTIVKNLMLRCITNIGELTNTDKEYYASAIQESKKKGLIFKMKRDGLKSIEEDLFEFNMKLRNVDTQDDAILLMRQINSRMSILEDYLREEEIDDVDRKRWEECYKGYVELRSNLSKKTIYNKKMYGLFVDYNALQNASQNGQLMNTYY